MIKILFSFVFFFFSFFCFSQNKNFELYSYGYVGTDVSLFPIIQPTDYQYPLRNRYIPNIGWQIQISPSFFLIRFGFEAHLDTKLLIQDRLELGLNIFKIFNPTPKQHLNVTAIGIRYNFNEFNIDFYKQMSRYYKVEYQYDLTDRFSASIYYEKDSEYNFSPKEPRWDMAWDVFGFKFKYKTNMLKPYRTRYK